MMNSYIKTELGSLKSTAVSLLDSIRVVNRELDALISHREMLLRRMESLEREIERQEQYQTVMCIPNDLALRLSGKEDQDE